MNICTSFQSLFAGKDYLVLEPSAQGVSFEPKIEHLNFIQQFFRWAFGCYADTHLATLQKHTDFLATFSSPDKTLDLLVEKVRAKTFVLPSTSSSEATVGSITYQDAEAKSVKLRWKQEIRDGKQTTQVAIGVPSSSFPHDLKWIPLFKDQNNALHMRIDSSTSLPTVAAEILYKAGYPVLWTVSFENGVQKEVQALPSWDFKYLEKNDNVFYLSYSLAQNRSDIAMPTINIVSDPFAFYITKAPIDSPWNIL